MNSYKHIIFDIDGTLIDTKRATLQSLQNAILQVNGNLMDTEKLVDFLGRPGSEALKAHNIPNIPLVLEQWNYFYQNNSSLNCIFKGIRDMLVQLELSGCKLGVVTSRTKNECQNDILFRDIENYFNLVIYKEDTFLHKPHGEPLLLYLHKTKSSANSSIFIGDSVFDMECSNAADIDFAFAGWACNKIPSNIKAKYYLHKPNDLIRIILNS